MKEILGMIGGAFVLVVIMSYTTTDNRNDYRKVVSVPLKQKGIFVTTDYAKVNKLIKKGWVVEDVDITGDGYYGSIQKFYTLIKY